MDHLNEERLILHYYGEEGETLAVEQHLDGCPECRSLYASLQRVLNLVDTLPLPERGEDYDAAVWQRLEPQLPLRRRRWQLPPVWRWTAAATAMAAMLVAAFVAGRSYPTAMKPAQMAENNKAGERVLLVAVGDYLERSQMVLIELQNARPDQPLDISAERERAADLVSESRLYRQTATRIGDLTVANGLDDLDRVLLEIAHAPSQLSPEEVERLRARLEAEGILFKVRVLGSNVRNREEAPANTPRQRL